MARRVNEELISQICSESDIVDYVSRYTTLKKAGRDYMGLCPFHNEKTPSFHVNREKQLFHCFGCGASGNLPQFVMRTENLDFIEAIKLMGERVNIDVKDDDGYDDERYEKKKKILEMNKLAARFFYESLKDENTGAEARAYFSKRKITLKTIIAYGLGYAPKSKYALVGHLKSKGYTEKEMIEASLAVERNGTVMDKFRDRVMFPIIDVRGNIIGFGGRIMNNIKEVNGYKIPKYLNSSDTPAFDKGRNLFSLNQAKNAKAQELILCEGYMDVISVYQAGIINIVATLGTAITENQAKLMLRYANDIVICYDSDEAGKKAALKAIDIISAAGGRARVMRLKGSKDPDEYIGKFGADSFKRAVKSAMPSTEFKISLIKADYDTSTTDGKIRFVSAAADILKGIRDAVEVDAYIKKIAEETEISKEAIYSEYKKKLSGIKDDEALKRQMRPKRVYTNNSDSDELVSKKLIESQKRILSLIVSSKKLYAVVKDAIKVDEYATAVYRQIAKAIYDCYENGQTPEEAMILNAFSGDEEMMREATSVFYNMEIYDADEAAVKELLLSIEKEKIDLQLSRETDPVKINELIKKKDTLG